MKTVLLFFAFCGMARAEITDAELDAIPREAIVQTLRHLQTIMRESGTRADAAELLEAETRGRLTFTQGQLTLAADSAKRVEGERDAAVAYGAQEHARADKAQKLADHRGNLLGILGAAALGFLSLQFMRFIPMPYALAAPVLALPLGYFAARLLL